MEAKTKLKVGDKVRVYRNTSSPGLGVGKEFVITLDYKYYVDSLKIRQTSATYNLSKGNYTFDVSITEKHLRILNSFKELEFVFASKNAPETIKRWEEVTAMLAEAVALLKKKRGLNG